MMAQRDGRERRTSSPGQTPPGRGRKARTQRQPRRASGFSQENVSGETPARKGRVRPPKVRKPGVSSANARTAGAADKDPRGVPKQSSSSRSRAASRKTVSSEHTMHRKIQQKPGTLPDTADAAKTTAQEQTRHKTATHRTVEERTRSQRPAWMRAARGFFGTDIRRPDKDRTGRTHRIPREHEDEENYGTPVAAHRFSGKFLGILIMVVVLLIGTAYPLTNYVDQQREINTTRARIASLKQENIQLQAEKTWWQDDDYVRQQARSRLFYVAPGDTPYTVTGIDSEDGQADSTSASGKNAPDDSWTNKLWGSLNDGSTPSPKPAE